MDVNIYRAGTPIEVDLETYITQQLQVGDGRETLENLVRVTAVLITKLVEKRALYLSDVGEIIRSYDDIQL